MAGVDTSTCPITTSRRSFAYYNADFDVYLNDITMVSNIKSVCDCAQLCATNGNCFLFSYGDKISSCWLKGGAIDGGYTWFVGASGPFAGTVSDQFSATSTSTEASPQACYDQCAKNTDVGLGNPCMYVTYKIANDNSVKCVQNSADTPTDNRIVGFINNLPPPVVVSTTTKKTSTSISSTSSSSVSKSNTSTSASTSMTGSNTSSSTTPTNTSQDQGNGSSSASSSSGLVIGLGVAGGLTLVLIIIGAVFFSLRKRSRESGNEIMTTLPWKKSGYHGNGKSMTVADLSNKSGLVAGAGGVAAVSAGASNRNPSPVVENAAPAAAAGAAVVANSVNNSSPVPGAVPAPVGSDNGYSGYSSETLYYQQQPSYFQQPPVQPIAAPMMAPVPMPMPMPMPMGTPGVFTIEQYLAAGWTMEQLSVHHPELFAPQPQPY
ncbi:hypothetical protein HDU76_006175 [Blyttiomyces sp. JEL0837]|nr:hypothetical protein HDU76_006175 [Blyttiomyces sp. JEL0837]